VKGKGFIHLHHTEYNIATAYALLHQPNLALAWLKRAAAEGWPCYPLFASDPDLDAIRKQAAFVAFLAEQRSQWERFRQLARSGRRTNRCVIPSPPSLVPSAAKDL